MLGFRTTISGDVPDYEAALARFVALAPQKVRIRMRQKLGESKSGRLYSRKRGEGFRRSHRASAQGEAPATDSGKLGRSLAIVKLSTMESALESNLVYAPILEDPNQLNRPMWLASLDELIPELTNDLAAMMV